MHFTTRQSWHLSFTLLFAVSISQNAVETREWSPDTPAGRMLLTPSCSSNSECATIEACGNCYMGVCENGDKNGAECTISSQTGTCSLGYCETCSVNTDCGDAGCAVCQRGGGVQACSFATDGQPCTPGGGGSGSCQSGSCVNSVANDPIIGGFDGNKFHFDEVGDFTLLQEGAGWKVDATFSAAPSIEEGGVESKESSWTTAVRVVNPQGEEVSCSIPMVYPNSSVVQVTYTPNGAPTVTLSPQMTEATLDQMTVAATLSWKEYAGVQYSTVVGCKVATPLMDINVYQVSGWEEAQAKPEEHGWAAPFTWLNLDFHLRKRLAAPVTGIIGATYPKEGTETGNTSSLRPGTASAVGDASKEGEARDTNRQVLDASPFKISFSVIGL